jgi:IS30 family transposase
MDQPNCQDFDNTSVIGSLHMKVGIALESRRLDLARFFGDPRRSRFRLVQRRNNPCRRRARVDQELGREGDLIVGPYGRSAIATLVERSTRYVMLAKISDQRAETVRIALEKLVKRLPSELFKSLTWDRGNEMAEHAKFTMRTKVDVYFCDPHRPWQRGSNENTKVCCDSISRRAPIFRPTARYTSAQLPESSTNDLEKHSA